MPPSAQFKFNEDGLHNRFFGNVLRFPEKLRVVLDLIFGQGCEIPILVLTRDIEYTAQDISARRSNPVLLGVFPGTGGHSRRSGYEDHLH